MLLPVCFQLVESWQYSYYQYLYVQGVHSNWFVLIAFSRLDNWLLGILYWSDFVYVDVLNLLLESFLTIRIKLYLRPPSDQILRFLYSLWSISESQISNCLWENELSSSVLKQFVESFFLNFLLFALSLQCMLKSPNKMTSFLASHSFRRLFNFSYKTVAVDSGL